MGDAEPSISSLSGSGSSCSTPSNNNHLASSCGSDTCRPPEVCTPHSNFEHHIPKLEPLQTPPSPPLHHTNGDPTVCAGCGMRIADRFYLQAVDRRWHAACLQCCQCRNPLDGEVTCFSRDGNIYCKKDYYRYVTGSILYTTILSMYLAEYTCVVAQIFNAYASNRNFTYTRLACPSWGSLQPA